MIDEIFNNYPDETFIKFDDLDEGVIGVEPKAMVLVYSIEKCIEIFCRDMSYEESVEYFYFNVEGAYLGEKTPIFIHTEF